MNKIQIKILFSLAVNIPLFLFAQDINRNVTVVKPYEPSLSDANKINILPKFEDTTTVTPSFDYSVLPVRINVPFEPKTINAAKMLGTPLEKLYKSYLKLGIGNYFTPLAEYNFNSLRSKDHSYGVFLTYKSSGRKLELENGDKVPAGYSIAKAEIYGNKYYRNSDLSGRFSMGNNGIHYYGYNTALFTDSFPDVKGKDTRQDYSFINASVKLNSSFTDSTRLNYKLGLDFNYLNDRFNNHESVVSFKTGINKLWGTKLFGLDVNLDYIKPGITIDSSSLTVISGEPYFTKKTAEYEFLLGGRLFADFGRENKLYLFPRAYLQINVVKNVIMPYVGIDGEFTPGLLDRVVKENPYVAPRTNPLSSDKMYVYAGIKGLLNSKSGFNASISYNVINNLPLFVNDSTGEWDNYFKIIYDDAELYKYSGEVYFDPFEGLHLMLDGNIYSYKLTNQAKAWQKPSFDMTFTSSYNFKNKIVLSFDVLAFGTRYAKPYVETEAPVKLDPILDINIGLEYRYSKILSAFLNFYNVTSSRYYYWNQYPAQRFNLMAGFTYKL